MYQFRIVPEENLIVLQFSGEVLWEEVGRYYGELVKDPNYHQELMGVCDLRGAELMFTPEESKMLARISREQQLTRGRWAFIADTPSGTALAMIFGKEIGDFHESQFFSSVDAASDFLDRDLSRYLQADK